MLMVSAGTEKPLQNKPLTSINKQINSTYAHIYSNYPVMDGRTDDIRDWYTAALQCAVR